MTYNSRYSVDANRLDGRRDIIDEIAELRERINQLQASLQVGFTAIELGELKVRGGDIVVVDPNDVEILRIKGNPVEPEITFWPLGITDTHQARLWSFDFDPLGTPDQVVQLGIEETDDDIDGGKVLLGRNFAILSHQPEASGGNEMYVWLNASAAVDELILVRGRWSNQLQADSRQGIYPGYFTASSGFTTWTHTYFTPFASVTAPVFTVGVAGTTIQWGIEAYSTSSFTIRFSISTGNKLVTFWNFRTH